MKTSNIIRHGFTPQCWTERKKNENQKRRRMRRGREGGEGKSMEWEKKNEGEWG